MNDRVTQATFLLSPLFNITNLEKISQFKLRKDRQSNRVDDLLINKTIPVTLFNDLLTFRDTDTKFELKGDHWKMITNKNLFVDLAKLSDEKTMFSFAKEIYFDERAPANRKTRDRSLLKLLKSRSIMFSASDVSKKSFSKKKIIII